MIFSTNIIDL